MNNNQLKFDVSGVQCIVSEQDTKFTGEFLELETLTKKYFRQVGLFNSRSEAVTALKKYITETHIKNKKN